MAKIILLIAAGLSLFIMWNWFKRLPKDQQKKQVLSILIWLGIIVVVLLVATGRLHWLGGLVAAIAAVIKTMLPLAIKVLPFLSSLRKNNNTKPTEELSLNEAYEILGITADASREEIITAHRKLMAKVHPDKGGNDFLATQLNTAKELALNALNEKT